ncbi:MAG TPA: DUF421 domain-containing protein, partial [Candidatus Omnitrophota bacterium]|nr:DUF421 domain-containing protein [Candidatus Omnitrophota bacterium]
LIVVVLVADASQNAMAGNYTTVTEGFLLIGTIMFWDFFLDYLSFHSRFIRRLLHPGPVKIIDDGKLVRRNMRKELISEEELMTKMREEGIKKIDDVKEAFVEGEGQISFLKKNE